VTLAEAVIIEAIQELTGKVSNLASISAVQYRKLSEENAALLARMDALSVAMGKGFDTVSGAQSTLDQDIANLTNATQNENQVVQSAVTLITGIPGLIQNAISQALAQGATQQQLQAITDATNAISNQAQTLANAVAANTPAAPSGGDTTTGGTSTTSGGTQPTP
jgi:hypothetical protein